MLKGTGVLATIGATAPFVGLFGTVWGIMNSFIGISQAQTTNLAVVAPGIAEALLATALGLAAAIPAVVIYNHFARRIAALSRAGRRHLGRRAAPRLAAISGRAARCRSGSTMASDELPENHEINVTPFIDVMLVLLIIFMVAAPLATVDVPVDLPSSTAERQPKPETPLYPDAEERPVVRAEGRAGDARRLGKALDEATGGKKDERIFLRADKSVPYGELMQAMNLLRTAGYLKVALVGLEQ